MVRSLSPRLFFLLGLACSLAVRHVECATAPEPGDLRAAGKVEFPVSCAPSVQSEFSRGVALLHSFFYEEARRVFTSVAERDPKCAMAQWGIAMTWWHPIWTPPTPDEMRAGKAAIEKAMAMNAGTDREREFITALNVYYNTPDSSSAGVVGQSCHGPVGPRDRVIAYEKAMHQLRDKYPDAFEIQAFYAFAETKRKPSGRRSLPDPLLRLSGTRPTRISRRAELCFHRAMGTSRAAHALAHLHAFGYVG
jgi:hypothetical protein